MTPWSEARAGLHAGILAAAQTLTHGLIAFAALGAAGVVFGMAAGLAASALAGVAMALFGATRPLVGTTTAATALLTAGLLAAAAPAGIGHAVLLAMLLAAGARMTGPAPCRRSGSKSIVTLHPKAPCLPAYQDARCD